MYRGKGQEHEGELEGLGHAAEEGTDGGGAHDTDGGLALVGLGGLDHGQSSAGMPHIMQGKKPAM